MAQTHGGAMKAAARLAGIPAEEYLTMLASGMKCCRICLRWKSTADSFDGDKHRHDGFASACIPCRRVKTRLVRVGAPKTKYEAQAAVDAVRHAIKRGELAVRANIITISDTNPQHRLDVVALCRACHHRRHWAAAA